MEIVGVDVRNRFPIFSHFLFREMVFMVVGMGLIFIIMGLYLKSALITLFTLFDVLFSFGIGYFLYQVVFNIPHFPFLGFLSVLLLIAIAADDVFIIYDAYEQAKEAHPDKDIAYWMSDTMNHAALSILVTSLTTGAALFANIVSDITDIKAFGIISGTAVVINYFLVITWVPSAIIMIEKISDKCLSKVKCCACFEKFTAKLKQISVTTFHNFLPACVRKLWFIWLFLFLGLGIGGIVVTFVTPKLNLPSTSDFALFSKDSVIEVWFQDLKYRFRYYQRDNNQGDGMRLMALWGVNGKDTGNHLDPESIGDLEFEPSFDLNQRDSQIWMRDFCHDLINSSFVSDRFTQGMRCNLDIFDSLLTSNCSEVRQMVGSSWIPVLNDCCGLDAGLPLEPDTFKKCHYFFTLYLVNTGGLNVYNSFGIPFYVVGSNEMKAYAFTFISNQGWTGLFTTMDNFYSELQNWMDRKRDSAPSGLKEGWMSSFYDSFSLYDLQASLASGTYEAIGVSMAAAFVVMLVTSLNVLITFYAILTIFLIISVCTGILVLLGWELNIVESVAFTMSVGLSIDFCIHYGMGYRMSEFVHRHHRVHESFKKVGPAIFMAVGTTFIAGACVMPSIVLFYIQLGTFLMLVMAFSWLFATFFFQSLLYVIGPNGRFCQIPTPCKACDSDEAPEPRSSSSPRVSPELNGVIPGENTDWSKYNGKQNLGYDTGPDDFAMTKTPERWSTAEAENWPPPQAENWPPPQAETWPTPQQPITQPLPGSPSGFREGGPSQSFHRPFSGDRSHTLAQKMTMT